MATTTRKARLKPPDVCRLTLTIRGERYALRPFENEGLRAWRLRKADGTVHDVAETAHGPTCDCPDQVFRHEGRNAAGCKHVRALRALELIGLANGRPQRILNPVRHRAQSEAVPRRSPSERTTER